MYSRFQTFIKYLKYYFSSSNGKGHGIHSPFVFEFITNILNDKVKKKEYAIVASLRRQLQQDHSVITVDDFGAGSGITKTNQRSIASIAKNAAKSPKYGQLLYRMVAHYQPGTILELGTSLGITTAYLGLAAPQANITTIEGAAAIAEVAKKNLQSQGLGHINLVKGNFDDVLPQILSKLPTIDFLFIDGNHRREPTERYFHSLLEKVNNETIFVFDDIHWSPEMEAAWHTIKSHTSVRCTIDLFFIGIVFFRKEFHEKQDFCIRF